MFGQFPGSREKVGSSFPKGTQLLAFMAVAPLGWSKVTTHDDKALRVVSGAGGGSGGTSPFSTVFGQTATGAHTLTTPEISNHLHTVPSGGTTTTIAVCLCGISVSRQSGTNTGSQGGGGSHTHPMDIRTQFIDVIIIKKN